AVVGVGYWLYQQTIDLSAKPPVIVDADADGLTDAREQELGTNPQKADTDEDGYQDFEEIQNGYNPLGAGKLSEK
ncbi:MAG: hypothetical protein A2458_04895, partial [Candidatus Kerfeldbacteria bacterium RIFOXYC2_FULL_38_9]